MANPYYGHTYLGCAYYDVIVFAMALIIWHVYLQKATKSLNLSEDIFAGMEATLRGEPIVHREYYQVR